MMKGFAAGYVSSGGDTRTAVISAFTAQAFNVVGGMDGLEWYEQAAAHGAVGGVSSEAMGGDFSSGYIGSFVAKGMTVGGVALGMEDNKWSLGILTTITGGTASQLSGGKFANGAMTAAMGYVFNYLSGSGSYGPDETASVDVDYDSPTGRGDSTFVGTVTKSEFVSVLDAAQLSLVPAPLGSKNNGAAWTMGQMIGNAIGSVRYDTDYRVYAIALEYNAVEHVSVVDGLGGSTYLGPQKTTVWRYKRELQFVPVSGSRRVGGTKYWFEK